MRENFITSLLIHGVILFFMNGCALHKPSALDVKNTAYFAVAMKQYPEWEALNNTRYHGLFGQLDEPLAKLRRDLVSCDRLRNDSVAFDKCTDEIDEDYAVLKSIEDSLRNRPRHI